MSAGLTGPDSPRTVGVPGDGVMLKDSVGKAAEHDHSSLAASGRPLQTPCYFIVTVLGFSFWFFMTAPFASHRETYWWLAMVQSEPLAYAFGVISSTYRPLAQGVTWLAFMFLKPSVFPTSVPRQALLQGFVYSMFVLAWWLIYSEAAQRRLLATTAFVVGGVFFSGYVHLFHIYGLFYVPVMLTLGALLRCQAARSPHKRELWFAAIATLLVFWHPFATALFVGFFFGFYLDTFWQRRRGQHVQAVAILLTGMIAILAMVGLFARAPMPLASRLFGFLVSYQTNEINWASSLVAFLLTQMVIASTVLSPKVKLAMSLLASAISGVFLLMGLPLLFVWFCAVLVKLASLRWNLFFLMLTAAVLPLGGGIGTPIYALFAIIVATYATVLGWSQAESALSLVKSRYVIGATTALIIVLLMVRVGISVPIVTTAARPLLTERERTYQLENVLAWLHSSNYCACDVAFAENASNPVDSVESAITRRNRPPASLEDVRLFWKTVLQCRGTNSAMNNAGGALVTFGGSQLAGMSPVFKIEGRYAGDAVVWVKRTQN